MRLVPLLLIIAVIAVGVLGGRHLATRRKVARRRAYFRDRSARVRQQWADLEEIGSLDRRR